MDRSKTRSAGPPPRPDLPEALRAVVGAPDALPPPPRLYRALVHASARGGDRAELLRALEGEPEMCVRVLQLANSATFGVAKRMVSAADAVSALGAEQLAALALAAHAFAVFEGAPAEDYSLEQHQAYSVCVARLARRFAPAGPPAELAFAGALVHGIGELLLAARCPERIAHVQKGMLDGGEPSQVVERRVLGITHAEAGAYLLEAWEVPPAIVELVASYQEPSRATTGAAGALAAVHAADALLGLELHAVRELDAAFLRAAGVESMLPEWRALVAAEAGIDPATRARTGGSPRSFVGEAEPQA